MHNKLDLRQIEKYEAIRIDQFGRNFYDKLVNDHKTFTFGAIIDLGDMNQLTYDDLFVMRYFEH